MRELCRAALLERLERESRFFSADELARPAVVLSPHPDDETLGCGHLIRAKLAAGATLDLVWLTDGRSSHAAFMSLSELTRRRRDEATEAAQRLGVDGSRLHFLDFPDGELESYEETAINRVEALLTERQTDQLFVPHELDPPPDHRATYRIASAANRSCSHAATLYRYPIWLYNQWPFVPFTGNGPREALRFYRTSIELYAAWSREFDRRIEGDPALKRSALEAHETQMKALSDNWPTLAQVSEGAFLDELLTGPEFFASEPPEGRRA